MLVERNDAKVGLFVMLGMAAAIALLVLVNGRRVVERHYPLKVRLAALEGVAMGTEVQLLGYRVGQVEAIDLKSDGVDYTFVATLGVREGIRLWEGTRAMVTTKGFGSAILELQLPPREERRLELKADAEIPGAAGPSFGAILGQVGEMLKNLNGLTTDIRSRGGAYFTDTPQIRAVLQQVQTTLTAYEELARQVRDLAARGGTSLEGLDATLASVRGSAEAVQKLLRERAPQLDRTLAELPGVLKHLDELTLQLQDTLKTSRPDLEETLKGLRRNLRSSEELLEQLKRKPNRLIFGTPKEAELEAARKAVEARSPKADPAPPRP